MQVTYLSTFLNSVEFKCFAGRPYLIGFEGDFTAFTCTVCALLVPGPEKAVAKFLNQQH